MDIVDDRGRLFGLVNVIDALVVLLVAVVVVAGVAFVLQSGSQPTEPTEPVEPTPETSTVTAVLDLGVQSEFVVEKVSEGDTYSPAAKSNLTVTDVYVAPQGDGARTLLAVELESAVVNGTVTYAGAPLRLGRQLTIQTVDYQVSGTIRNVGTGLDQRTTRVLVSQTLNSSAADAVQVGDTLYRAGYEVASIESVDVFATENPDRRRVFVGLALQTVVLGNGTTFGTTPIQWGATLLFRTDDYHISGSIERVGASELRGEPSTRNVTLELGDVSPEITNALRPGLTETISGQTNARVTDVDSSPATAVITTDDGRIVVGEHPTRKRVTLTAELSVRETDTGLTFKGRSLELGRTVPLDLGTVTVEATVVEIGE